MVIADTSPRVYLVRLLLPVHVARALEEPHAPSPGGPRIFELVVVAVVCEGDPAFVSRVRDIFVGGDEGREEEEEWCEGAHFGIKVGLGSGDVGGYGMERWPLGFGMLI